MSNVNAYFQKAEQAAHEEGVSKDAQVIALALLAVAEEVNILATRNEQMNSNRLRADKVSSVR